MKRVYTYSFVYKLQGDIIPELLIRTFIHLIDMLIMLIKQLIVPD